MKLNGAFLTQISRPDPNYSLKVLQKKKLVRLGEMGYGSGHYGEYYVELTPSGVDVGLKLAGRERQL
jgi:hypothetical protein